MKIRLHPSDCVRLGVPEVIDFDITQIGLREAAALQKATGLDPQDMSEAINKRDLEALAALVWLVVGRALGKRPDWDSFDVNGAIEVEGDEPDPGKDEESSTAATSSS